MRFFRGALKQKQERLRHRKSGVADATRGQIGLPGKIQHAPDR